MSPADFLRKDAETLLCEDYVAAGTICRFSTNCEYMLQAARESFMPARTPVNAADFSLRFWVDYSDRARPPWPKPYVRGLDHLVFAGFDTGSSILADLRTRRVIGRFSAGMAADISYWQCVVLPIVLTIVSASVGIAELHCACVARDHDGILLAGPSRSGKSTLAFALSRIGMAFLSDDRTFISSTDGEVFGWGLSPKLKLRHDAAVWFQDLRHQPTDSYSGEPALLLDTRNFPGLARIQWCRPRSLIFLERGQKADFRIGRMTSVEAMVRLEKALMAELPDGVKKRSSTIARLAELPCWLLHYGGEPERVARRILQHIAKPD